MCVGEQHSLRNLKFDYVKELTSLKHQVCQRSRFPEEPQTLTVSKHWPHWNIKCSCERDSLRNLKLWLCRSIDLTETSNVLAIDIPWGTLKLDCVERLTLLKTSVPASDIPWGASNFVCVEALTSLKQQMCRRAIFLVNLKLWLYQSISLSETSNMPASDIPWGTSNIIYICTFTVPKHQPCRYIDHGG